MVSGVYTRCTRPPLEWLDSNRADRFENGSRNHPREGCVDRYTACVDRHMPHLGNSADRTMCRSTHVLCRSTHYTCTASFDTFVVSINTVYNRVCHSTRCITMCVVRHLGAVRFGINASGCVFWVSLQRLLAWSG